MKPQISESPALISEIEHISNLMQTAFDKNDYFTNSVVDWDKVKKLTKQKRAFLMLSINKLPASKSSEKAMDIMDKMTIRQRDKEEQN
jgi:hypothetical protein